jgi:hypothetical protein
MADEPCYTIDDLSQLTGVSRRTVRYYVHRELIPSPEGRGRGQHYSQEHVAGILRVQAAKRHGLSLAAILRGEGELLGHVNGYELDSEHARTTTRICLSPDRIWLEVAQDDPVPSRAQLDRLTACCLRELGVGSEDRSGDRFRVVSRRHGPVFIPDALPDGAPLRVAPDDDVTIQKITPAIAKAESDGLIAIVTSE